MTKAPKRAAGFAAIAVAAVASCFSGGPQNGVVLCGPDPARACVVGYYCASDGYCWKEGSGPSGSDGGDVDGGTDSALPQYRVEPAIVLIASESTAQLSIPSMDAVTWSVTGGIVDQNGLFTAPAGRGSFTVTATRISDQMIATGVVHVAPAGLSLLAGAIGGVGTADGTGPDARVNPRTIVGDGLGTYYVTELGCLRKLTAAGAISAFVGLCGKAGFSLGTGTAARVGQLYGAAVHPTTGDIYVSEATHRILKITAAGVVTTYAGTGVAGFNAVDTVRTSAQFSDPRGLAFNAAGTALYIADLSNHWIRKIDLGTETVSRVAGHFDGALPVSGNNPTNGTYPLGRLNSPVAVAVDAAEVVYMTESGSKVIKKLTGTTVAIVASNVGFSPAGLALDGTTLFVADRGASGYKITTFSTAGVAGPVLGTGVNGIDDGPSPTFGPLQGAWFDVSAGALWVADGNATIRKVTVTPTTVTPVFASTPVGLPEHVGATDDPLRFNHPRGAASDKDGNLYIADTANGLIRRMTPDGVVTTVVGNGGQTVVDGNFSIASFADPRGIAVDVDGNLFVTETSQHVIRKIDLLAQTVETWAGIAGGTYDPLNPAALRDGPRLAALFNNPRAILADSQHNLYVLEGAGSGAVYSMRKIDVAGDVTTQITGQNLQMLALTRDDADNIYYVDQRTVRRVVPMGNQIIAGNGSMSGFMDGSSSLALFDRPSAIAVSRDGTKLIVAEEGNGLVRVVSLADQMVSTAGGVLRQAGIALGAPYRINSPATLVRSPRGTFYMVDTDESAVFELFP